MTELQNKLKEIVITSINEFNTNESYLLKNNLSERCICSKFAMYIERNVKKTDYVIDGRSCNIKELNVDVEYNRGNNFKENKPKMLFDGKIVVDLIVHKRGCDDTYGFQNFICIEMKKSNDRRKEKGLRADIERLHALTSFSYGFLYQIGFLIIANIKTKKLEIYQEFCLQ